MKTRLATVTGRCGRSRDRRPGIDPVEGPSDGSSRPPSGHRSTCNAGVDDAGFSMIAVALSLLATAVLTVVLIGTVLNPSATSGGTGGNLSSAPGVAQAAALQAQQTLSIALTAADSASVGAGGYGSLEPSDLAASNPSITFVTGPSTDSGTVSMAVTGDGGMQTATSTGVGAGLGAAGGAVESAGGNEGSITLADRSTSGTCWLIWKSAAGGTWYGAQTGQASCTAPVMASAPSPAPVSSSSIGWQQGSFPSI